MKLLSWIWDNFEPVSIIAVAAAGFIGSIIHMRFPTHAVVNGLAAKLKRDMEAKEEALKATLAEHDGRIKEVEAALKALATKDDINRILIALEKQDGERRTQGEKINGIQEAMRRIEKPIDLINDYLLNGNRK